MRRAPPVRAGEARCRKDYTLAGEDAVRSTSDRYFCRPLPSETGRVRAATILRVDYDALPGGDLVRQGLDDLARGVETVPSLLVSIGAPRLRRAGVPVPETVIPDAERRLYLLLASDDSDSAHSRYNAWLGRLVGFENAVECVS